jgi:hypothetical protein
MSSGWLGSLSIAVILANQDVDVGNIALFLFRHSALLFRCPTSVIFKIQYKQFFDNTTNNNWAITADTAWF